MQKGINTMKIIYTLTNTNSGEKLYFSSYEKQVEYCEKIIRAALKAGILPWKLPTFDFEYSSSPNYILGQGPLDPEDSIEDIAERF